jgi:MFS family permease
MFLDVKCYFFAAMSFSVCIGAAMTTFFGPLILNSFGFDKYKATLLNIPFGALQCFAIFTAAWVTSRTRWKSATLGSLLVFILTGLVMLYALPRDKAHNPSLLVGYYFLAFVFGCFNVIVSWILAKTAGQTKKSTMMAVFNGMASAGAIVGPLLFDAADAPEYRLGIRSNMGVFCAMLPSSCCRSALWCCSIRCRSEEGSRTASLRAFRTTRWRAGMWICGRAMAGPLGRGRLRA